MTTQLKCPSVPSRCVLEGVPRIHFYEGGPRCPEDFPFASAVRATLEYLGFPFACEHAASRDESAYPRCLYAFINGVSGMAFRLLWHADMWDFGNGGLLPFLRYAPDLVEPLRRTFAALGYGCEVVLKEAYTQESAFQGVRSDDEAYYRQRIIESIMAKGLPVLALGVVGPPEPAVITGYDDGGEVLLGWSPFQSFPEFAAGVESDPSGYLRKRGWYRGTLGLILIGDRQARPVLHAVHKESLAWALAVMRARFVQGYHAGFAAYEAWTESLLLDDQFAIEDMEALREHYGVHYDTVGVVAEARYYGAQFLKEMAAQEPEAAAELQAAAACFEAEHDLMWEVWNLAGGNAWTDEQALKLAERAVRRRIVPVILQARDRDIEAAGHLEGALAQL